MRILRNIKDVFMDGFYKWQRDSFLERIGGLIIFLILLFVGLVALLFASLLGIGAAMEIYTTVIAAPVATGFVLSIVVGLILIAYFGGSNERY